jgi:homopolymeric O-antigen transport system ATP-binding protein
VLGLCSRALVLEGGQLVADGEPRRVVRHYLAAAPASAAADLASRTDRRGDGTIRLTSLQVAPLEPEPTVRPGSRLRVSVGYRAEQAVHSLRLRVSICDDAENGIYLLDSELVGGLPAPLPPAGQLTCQTGPLNLAPGRCYLHLELRRAGVCADQIRHATSFDVEPDDFYGSGQLPGRDWTLCLIDQRWSVEAVEPVPLGAAGRSPAQ